jgi:hypothetical protein
MGELAMSRKKERGKKEEKKLPFIVATYVYASSQGQRTHSARTKSKLHDLEIRPFLAEEACLGLFSCSNQRDDDLPGNLGS